MDDLDPALIEGFEENPWLALYKVSCLLNSRAAVDLDRTLWTILSVVLSLTGGQRALLLLLDDDGNPDVQMHRSLRGGDPRRDQLSKTIVRQVFDSGEALLVPDIQAEPDLRSAQSVGDLAIQSALCVPLKTGLFEGAASDAERRRFPPYLVLWQDVIGAIYVDSNQTRAPYLQQDMALLEALANIAATAISTAQLHKEATRDNETGMLTRRYFELLLDKVHRLSGRFDFPYGLLRIDVDAAAPGGVEATGRTISALLRESDLPARYGAQAFAILLPYAGEQEVRLVAEKILSLLGSVRLGGSAAPGPAADPAELKLQADHALASATRSGRGAFVFWSPEIGTSGPRADRLAGLVTRSEGADHRSLERLVDENERLRQSLKGKVTFLGDSRALLEALDRVRKSAPTDISVLIHGESGSGKELIARALHAASPRAEGPFVVIDCGAIPENLVESELFGHEAGAFTGATRQQRGKFELADGGTLFLDEIGELPLAAQVRFLRTLQEREIRRLGSAEPIHVNVRIVAATHRNLEAEIAAGRFRQDLFYRLNHMLIELPPLRERGRDALTLARFFLDQFCRQLDRPVPQLEADAIEALLAHDWPGNVRELEHCIQQAAILAEGELITAADLRLPNAPPSPEQTTFKAARRRAIDAFERDYILRLLDQHEGDIDACAEHMGLSKRRFRELRQKLNIRRENA